MIRKYYPNLAAYLYDGSWDGIQPRDGGKLVIKAKGMMVYATLQNPTEGLETQMGAPGLSELLEGLERFCASSESQWTEMRWGTGAQKRKDLRKKELDKQKAETDD